MRETPLEGAVLRLQLVAWEITRSCNLYCAHCRASAVHGRYQGELSTGECLRLIDDTLQVGRPVLILSGGEPLLRQDLFQVAAYAVGRGLRVVMGTNGTLLTEEAASRAREVPVSRAGVGFCFISHRGRVQGWRRATSGREALAKSGLTRLCFAS